MRDRVSLLASRIAEIEERFSKAEIREAIKLLQHQRSTSNVQPFLVQRDVVRKDKKSRDIRKRKSVESQRSKAVLDLQHKDPEKYAILSEFDSLLRKGSVLPEIAELKMLGKSLSKTFSAKSSRREAISKLMKVLAEKPISEIRQVVTTVISAHQEKSHDSDYFKLAQFIITGKASASQEEHGI